MKEKRQTSKTENRFGGPPAKKKKWIYYDYLSFLDSPRIPTQKSNIPGKSTVQDEESAESDSGNQDVKNTELSMVNTGREFIPQVIMPPLTKGTLSILSVPAAQETSLITSSQKDPLAPINTCERLSTPVFCTSSTSTLGEVISPYEENAFLEDFRVSQEIVENIAENFERSKQFKPHSGRYGKLSPKDQILTFLWFCGRQTASYREVADRFNITISSLHRINNRVVLFLSNLSPQIITWPSDEEKVKIEQHFNENGFPGTIGAIDGCHIKIDKPEIDPESYINKKGFYSVQMQVVCDNEKRIRDVFVGSPGSVHDSGVLKNSPLFESLEEKCGPYFILGDNGYPLLKKLLTPFRDKGQLNRKQINYNTKLARNRNVIQHCFGIMKQKFRLLNHVKLRNIQFIVHFIRAMCVLHNISINDKLPLEAVEECNNLPAAPTEIDIDVNVDEDRDAQRIRDNVVNTLQI